MMAEHMSIQVSNDQQQQQQQQPQPQPQPQQSQQHSQPSSPLINFANGPPPSKRPRLMTDFSSSNSQPAYGPPFGNPGMGVYQHAVPSSPLSYSNSQTQESSGAMEASSAQPKSSAGVMGPPEKPKADRATDINDLSDLVNAAGVDLKAEESYLTAVYKHQRPSQAASTYSSQSLYSSQHSSQTLIPETAYAQWSQSSAATSLPLAARPVGPLNQPTLEPGKFEESLKNKQIAARLQAQASTQHLSNPFLQSNTVRERMHKRTSESQVRLKMDGFQLRDAHPEDLQMRGVSMRTGDTEALVAAQVLSLTQTSALAEILSLISLATQERVRALLEDSYATSRARAYGDNGLVPPEWCSIAVGATQPEQVTVRPCSISGTAWDAVPDVIQDAASHAPPNPPPDTALDTAVSPMTVFPSKRPLDGMRRTPPPNSDIQTQQTIRFPSKVPSILIEIAKSELEQERKRLATRVKRRAAKQDGQGATAATPDETANSPGAASSTASTAATNKEHGLLPGPKMTKKERERQKKETKTEDVLRQQANATAAIALGRTSKKYSWLTKASPIIESSSLTTGAGQRANLAAQASGTKKPAAPAKPAKPAPPAENPGLVSRKTYQQLGLWKEPPGLELRDIINVLEREDKERKALLRGYQRLAADDH